MNLYTILMNFEDRSVGVGQLEAISAQEAMLKFIGVSEALEEYDREKILSIATHRAKNNILLSKMPEERGLWLISFGAELLNIPELSTIHGGWVIQSA